jgi:hypothetical protein
MTRHFSCDLPTPMSLVAVDDTSSFISSMDLTVVTSWVGPRSRLRRGGPHEKGRVSARPFIPAGAPGLALTHVPLFPPRD